MVEILLRIARMKIVAVLLGPAGVGVVALYYSTVELIRSATGFGLDYSSVKEIAQANGKGDEIQVSKTITVLRRWVWFTGTVGMVLTALFCDQISKYAFGDESYSTGIAVVSVVLLISAVSGGQFAILQGLRKINLMAKAQVYGLVIAFVVSVPLYWIFRIDAIVPVFVISELIVLAFTWSYVRQIKLQPIELNLAETVIGGKEMCRLGFFMVVSATISLASMYLIRVVVANSSGVEAVGLFQCAWAISSLYLAAVLQAMGTDYFPRLSEVNEDNGRVVTLVNEQTEIAVLIAGPVVVAMLSFVTLVVLILYSSKFTDAIFILHWMLAGTLLKVISWPLGFIMLAKGRGAVFIASEMLGNATLLLLTFLFWDRFGIEVTGIAFTMMYIVYLGVVYLIAKKMCGFAWSRNCWRLIIIFGILTVCAFFNSRYSEQITGYLIGSALVAVASLYSLFELNKIVNIKSMLGKVFGN